jgi:hypothetical protein
MARRGFASARSVLSRHDQNALVDDSDADPGWRLTWRSLLFLFPGYLRMSLKRPQQDRDGLETAREVWLSFVGALLLFGVVILLVVPGSESSSAGPAVLVLLIITGVCLVAEGRVLARPLACTDLRALAGSFRTRYFLAIALSEAIALGAFVATFLTGNWWVYWTFLPVALGGFARLAPTSAHLEAQQEELRMQGCPLSLIRALRSPPAASP